jgi:hypothetical protein
MLNKKILLKLSYALSSDVPRGCVKPWDKQYLCKALIYVKSLMGNKILILKQPLVYYGVQNVQSSTMKLQIDCIRMLAVVSIRRG